MDVKTELIKREPSGFFLERNLKALPESFHEPLKAAENIQTPVDKQVIIQGVKNPVTTIFIGFSTRALIDGIKRKKKRVDLVVVIEPRLEVFKEVLMTEDISELLADPNVEFLVGIKHEELLTNLFKVLTKQSPREPVSRVGKILNMEKVVDPFTYGDMSKSKEAQEINSIIDQTVKHIELSMGCPDDQSRRWELMKENRHNMFKSWNCSDLWGKFNKTNAIVLGGGPSLDGFIKAYKEFPNLNNCIILAADAVLYKLLEAGIKPHVVFRCERKKTQIFKGVDKSKTEGIYYAAYPWTPPEFFDLFHDHFYLFRSNGVCLFTGIKHGFVDGGVSSGNACFEFALNLGCPNIFLAGIDLVFVDGKTHTDGTQVEFNPENSKHAWSKIKTNDGKEGTTIPVWQRCCNEYGQSIDKHKSMKKKDFKVYNTSLKGGVIQGTEYKPWEELHDLCKDKVNVKERIKQYRKPVTDKEKEKFYDICKEALAKMKEIREACSITMDLEKDAKRTCENEFEKIFRRIKRECEDDKWKLIKAIRQITPNLSKLTKNIADVYDTNFKSKYVPDKYYRTCLMDVLQLDVYHYENKVNSLTNMREFDDDKFLDYASLTRDFTDRVEFYADKFIEWFEEIMVDKDKTS